MKSLLIILMLLTLSFMISCSGETGDSCSSDGDCDTTLVCEESYPGGYCIAYDCDYTDSSACSEEAQCTYFNEINRSFCLKKCNSNSDCRSDYSCQGISNHKYKVCLPE
ncbi:hypothetical protein JXR93_03960 [bacterium]|nr:hypothetical protein [bacterium]